MGVMHVYTPMTTYEQEIDILNRIKSNYECETLISDVPPYTLYCSKDISKILKISNVRSSMRNYCDDEKKIVVGKVSRQKTNYLTYKGLFKLLTRSRRPETIEFSKKNNFEIMTTYCLNIECDVISCILKTFSGNIMKPQYKIDNYRIDLYFPEYLLAIECDEPHHKNPENKLNDMKRQSIITQLLGCRFIRFDPYDKNFDLFDLLNSIYIHLSVFPRQNIGEEPE